MKGVGSFRQIRDIPYSIPIDSNQEDSCCNGKARRLKILLEQEGFKVRYRVCTFQWSHLNIPIEILELQKDDLATHVYLDVDIDGVWVKVDPTWDPGLKNIFPVAEWDGKNDTELAVKPIEIYSPEKSDQIMSGCDSTEVGERPIDKEDDFDTAFNKWLEECRDNTKVSSY